MTGEPTQRPVVREIDLIAIFSIFWKRRMLILFGTLAVTTLAAGFSFMIPVKYRSKGFYVLGNTGVPIQFYRRSSLHFTNLSGFLNYIRSESSFSKDDKLQIAKTLKSRENNKNWIIPFYAFSKEDTRELALITKEQSNSVLGLNLIFLAQSPELAVKLVSFSGRYIRDCLMYLTLFDYISGNAMTARTSLQKNDNELIESRFGLEQQEKKLADMWTIMRKYPDAARRENWQLMSIQDGGEHFLSPLTQLVGIESRMADLRREVALLERNRQKMLLRIEFFELSKSILDKPIKQGEPLFQELTTILTEFFSKKDLRIDFVREVYNELDVDQQNFNRTFSLSYRFVSGPTVPTRYSKLSRGIIVLIGFFLGGFFFVCLAFGLVWVQNRRQAILSSAPKS